MWQRITRKQLLTMVALSVLLILAGVCIFTTSAVSASSSSSAKAAGLSSNCYKSSVDISNSSLELVYVVFRHGARTPVDTYPNDPYVNRSFEPIGWGHITNKGKAQLFEMGAWLNRRYGDFLAPYYTPDRVHAQSTASPRALMSLTTVLASMFPPQGTPMAWNTDFNWQPIPVFSQPLEEDTLLLVRKSCPRYFEARDEVLASPEVRTELSHYESLFTNLTELSGMRVASADDVNSLYITLLAEKEFGLPLPKWTKQYFPHKMQFLAEQSYVYNSYTREMQKIKGGPFLKKMYDEMLAKREGSLKPRDRRMFIYTGHDWTVGNILSALQVWERQMPRFSVMAIFELHKNLITGEYYVEIFLGNDEKGCLQPLKVPNCTVQCPLDKLIALSADVLPMESHEQRCRAKNDNYVEPPPRPVDQHEQPPI